MNTITTLSRFSLLPMFLFMLGCTKHHDVPGPAQSVGESGRHTPPYSFETMNRTGMSLGEYELVWGANRIPFGTIVANGNKAMSFVDYPVPEAAMLCWRSEDGIFHKAEVQVPRIPTAALADVTFCFVILPDQTPRAAAFSQKEYSDQHDVLELARNGGPAYVVGFKNMSSTTVTRIRIFFGPHRINADDSAEPRTGWRFRTGLPYQITDTALVQWTTPDDVLHEKVVELKSRLPEDINGVCIGFLIGDNDALGLKVLPWANRQSWMEDDRPNDPIEPSEP